MAPTSTPLDRRSEILAALLRIVQTRGLEHGSIREVAAEAGVSIGTVQHHFPTKDALLIAAYREMIEAVLDRFRRIDFAAPPRDVIRLVLAQLLPLDETRVREARLQLAFTARAATTAELRELHQQTISELHTALSQAVSRVNAESDRGSTRVAGDIAESLLAATDGLATHAVSAPDWRPAHRLQECLDLVLDALLP